MAFWGRLISDHSMSRAYLGVFYWRWGKRWAAGITCCKPPGPNGTRSSTIIASRVRGLCKRQLDVLRIIVLLSICADTPAKSPNFSQVPGISIRAVKISLGLAAPGAKPPGRSREPRSDFDGSKKKHRSSDPRGRHFNLLRGTPYTWVFNTWFFGIVNACSLGGPA